MTSGILNSANQNGYKPFISCLFGGVSHLSTRPRALRALVTRGQIGYTPNRHDINRTYSQMKQRFKWKHIEGYARTNVDRSQGTNPNLSTP